MSRHQHDKDLVAAPDNDATRDDRSDTKSNAESPTPRDDADRYNDDQFSADDEDDDVKSNGSAQRVSSAGSARHASDERADHDKKSITSSRKESPTPHDDQAADDNSISVTYTDEGSDKLISDYYQALTDQIEKRISELKSNHFKDYTGLTELQNTSKNLFSHLKYNEDFLSSVCHALSETSKSLNVLNAAIIEKLETESLQSWIDRPITSQDVADQAGSRELMSKAADLRQSISKTEHNLTEATKRCEEMELAAVEAQQIAVQARQAAEEAARRAEEAERAAQQELKEEEQKKKRAEEQARRQAEEEKIRKEKEEKRRAEMDQLKGTPEEQERLNPNNWPSYTYKSETANEFDGGYECIIRAMPGVLGQEDVEVTRVSQLSCSIPLNDNDELVGNIINVEPDQQGDDESASSPEIILEEPLSILVPHCAPRSAFKEAVVMWRQLHHDNWVPLEAKDISIEAVKEAKLVECRPTGFGTFAVVHRLKTDYLTITKKGGKVASSVDSRLCIQCRPGAFKFGTNFTLQIQPVDLASVSDVKTRFPEDCADLISSSPIIKLEFPSPVLNRPIQIVTPIPANSAKPRRPMTAAVDKERSKASSRPASAFGLGSYSQEEDEEDALHLLTLAADGRWVVNTDITYNPQNKKGDLVAIDTKVIPSRFWLLRTKASLSVGDVEMLASRLFDYLHRRIVQFIMRQKNDDPTDITLVCVQSLRMERAIRHLDGEGYTEGMQVSQQVFVTEGQKVEVRFRGNLQPDEEVHLEQPFNSNIKCQINMYIAEVDKYAQKSFGSYRGFAQFYVEERRRDERGGMVMKDVYDEADKKKGDQRKPIGSEEVWDSVMLAELLINLPKPEPEPPKPLKKARISLLSEGPIDDQLLKQLSADLGDEWKLLATHLNVKKTRLQSIMRNHVNSDSEAAVYEMLLTWIKRIPRSMDKVKMLCDALRSVGRLDLVEDVKDREYDYKEMRAEQLKDIHLRQMFVKIAQHSGAMARWKDIAEYLKVSNTDLLNIENEFTKGRERCLQALETWKTNQDVNASPNQLLKALKYYRLTDLAGEIRRMIKH